MNPYRRATIADVARTAGVSRATVSRVMNSVRSVDPELAARVRQIAEELQYEPSTLARGLSLGRSQTVALVVPDLGNQAFQRIVQAFSTDASREGYHTLLAETFGDPVVEQTVTAEARRRCDAVVLLSPASDDAALDRLLERAAPAVVVGRRYGVDGSLSIDHGAGMGLLVDHLAQLGHQRLAYLSGPEGNRANAARLEGLAEALERHPGVSLEILPCGATMADGHGAAEPLLAARVTAALGYNDLVAFGLLARLNELGVAVPRDLSVTGVDDIDLASYAVPPLTTLHVDQTGLGREVWQHLRAILDGADPLVHEPHRPALVARESTGAAPRSPGTNANGGRRLAWAPTGGGAHELRLGSRTLLRYESGASMPVVHSPRPYAHPVTTLDGTELTVSTPRDHRHHYGLSLAVALANDVSFWGGRTYVVGEGSTLLDNHGSQVVRRTAQADQAGTAQLRQALDWLGPDRAAVLVENRTVSATLLREATHGIDAWSLNWESRLKGADGGGLRIDSPATSGRVGAGYGGLFWRFGTQPLRSITSPAGQGIEAVHGQAVEWVSLVIDGAAGPATVVLWQPREVRPWFARTQDYVGVGPALAWDAPLLVAPGEELSVGLSAVIVDGSLSPAEVTGLWPTIGAERVNP